MSQIDGMSEKLRLAAEKALEVLSHIRRCPRADPASGQVFVQIHEGSATMAQIEDALAALTEALNEERPSRQIDARAEGLEEAAVIIELFKIPQDAAPYAEAIKAIATAVRSAASTRT